MAVAASRVAVEETDGGKRAASSAGAKGVGGDNRVDRCDDAYFGPGGGGGAACYGAC